MFGKIIFFFFCFSADKELLSKQKSVFQLLHHIHQPVVLPELNELLNSFDLEKNVTNFNDVESVKRFLKLYETGGILRSGKVFTPLYESHIQQAKAVFEVLYNAKDWNTFLNAATWMRERINDGLFIYALSVAVLHRPDTQNLVLPPLYEVCPHLFLNAETIQKAYDARMKISSKRDDKGSVIIPTNYTGWMNTRNPELRTSYLTEDIGFNFYHLIHEITYPSWLKKEHYGFKNERQGELFHYTHQQILARYKLERYANNMNKMKSFSFDEPNIVGYNPNLLYKNGQSVPNRPENLKLRNCDFGDVERVKDFERRVRDAIDSGFVKTVTGEKIPLTAENGIDILGRLIVNSTTSVNPDYYGSLLEYTLKLLGHIVDPYHENNVAPSALENFQSMLRDPMFYRIYGRVEKLFNIYKKKLPAYTKEMLAFPGVKVERIEVDKLMTFFESFDVDITNAVNVGKAEDDKFLRIIARQPRLNHKDFNYRITLNSEQEVPGMVYVYLAPKYDLTGTREFTLSERIEYMIQLDRFPYQLKSGKNTIERSSSDFSVTVEDMTSFRVLYKTVEEALQGKSQFYVNNVSCPHHTK